MEIKQYTSAELKEMTKEDLKKLIADLEELGDAATHEFTMRAKDEVKEVVDDVKEDAVDWIDKHRSSIEMFKLGLITAVVVSLVYSVIFK